MAISPTLPNAASSSSCAAKSDTLGYSGMFNSLSLDTCSLSALLDLAMISTCGRPARVYACYPSYRCTQKTHLELCLPNPVHQLTSRHNQSALIIFLKHKIKIQDLSTTLNCDHTTRQIIRQFTAPIRSNWKYPT